MESNSAFLLISLFCFIKGTFEKQTIVLSRKDIDQIVEYSFLKFKASRKKGDEDFINQLYYKYLLYKTRVLYNYFYRYIKDNDVNLVVVWNGYHVEPASCVKAARVAGIKVLYMENGFFPRTIVVDEKGVNAANSLVGKDAQFYQKVQMVPEKLAQLKETKLVPRELRRKYFGKEALDLPPRYFFLPFQVYTDTQVLLNSPQIHNMHELVDQVYSALEKYNHKYNQDHWLVIKEHPSDFGRINYNGLKKKYKNKKVIFTTTLPSSELIESSRAVITINSTVGIEALLKGKPVITLGEAFYNVEGLVHHCIDLSRLQDDMWNAVSEKMNSGLVDKFLYYLRYQYLVEIDKKNLTKENIVPVLNKISEVSGEK